jgi:hypothetical protein
VESVLDAFTCGASVDGLATSLQLKNMQQGGGLLQPTDQDILLSWIILIMLTAQEVGVPRTTGDAAQQQPEQPSSEGGGAPSDAAAAAAAGITQSFSREVLGLLTFVKQAARLYFEEGYSVARLQSLQATVAADPGQGQSQALQMMQQYTRLVVITLEVAACARLPTQRQLTNPTSLDAPSGYTAAFAAGTAAAPALAQQWQQQQQEEATGAAAAVPPSPAAADGAIGLLTAGAFAARRGGVRAHAVLLNTAFCGAAIGSPYSLRAFVLGALAAYEAGVPAAVLHGALAEAEFAQSGGLVPALPLPEVRVDVNRMLYGRWLSIVYMAAAQLNAVFPGSPQQPGWAWYGGEDAVQANGMAAFVAQSLTRLQEEDAAAAPGGGGGAGGEEQQQLDTAKPREDPLVAKIK